MEVLQLCYWELMKKRINMKVRLDSRNMRNNTTKDADKGFKFTKANGQSGDTWGTQVN